MTVHTQIAPVSGDIIEVALNRLKKSPRNARITAHKSADVETLASQYWHAAQIGTPHVLDGSELDRVRARFAEYGQKKKR